MLHAQNRHGNCSIRLLRFCAFSPDEYSKHGKLTLEQHFSAFIRYLAFTHFLPKDREIRNDREMLFSIKQVRRSIEGIIDSGIASSIWREEFRHAIDTRPDLEIYQSVTAPGCEGCNKHDRIASVQARFLVSAEQFSPWTCFAESHLTRHSPRNRVKLMMTRTGKTTNPILKCRTRKSSIWAASAPKNASFTTS